MNTLDESLTGRANHAETINPNYQRFAILVVQGGTAVYTIELSDRDDLPFTHKVIGNSGPVYGYWTETSGRYVAIRRNGWRDRRGTHGVFSTRDQPNPGDNRPTFEVKGWATP